MSEPPKRYVTPTAAAAAAPWSKSPAPADPVASAPVPTIAPAPAATNAPRAPVNLESVPSGTFQGSLDVMDLADLTQAIAGGGKTGRLILALPRCTPEERDLITQVATNRSFDSIDPVAITDIVRKYDALEETHAIARDYAARARTASTRSGGSGRR